LLGFLKGKLYYLIYWWIEGTEVEKKKLAERFRTELAVMV